MQLAQQLLKRVFDKRFASSLLPCRLKIRWIAFSCASSLHPTDPARPVCGMGDSDYDPVTASGRNCFACIRPLDTRLLQTNRRLESTEANFAHEGDENK